MKKIILCIILVGVFMGCGKKEQEGKSISVLVAPWYSFPESLLQEFTEETGIAVEVENLAWDSMKNKVVTSVTAGGSPADVTQFTSGWVGSLGKAGYFEDLSGYLTEEDKKDMANIPLFSYEGKLYGIPTYNDFRLTYINKRKFTEAGLEVPKTIKELSASLDKLNATEKGALVVPYSATSATATPWFLMTKAYGGEIFDENWNPLFTEKGSAGYKAMEFLIDAYRNQLADANSITYSGSDVVANFKNGRGAVDLAGWSGNVTVYTAEDSKIKDDVQAILVPGLDGRSRTYSLAESFGVPVKSPNKKEAVEFLLWLNRKDTMKKTFTEMGIFPNRISVIKELDKEGKLPFGDVVAETLPKIDTLFLNAKPAWYSQFITETVTVINQMAKGSIGVDEGLNKLSDFSIKVRDEK